MLTTRLPPLSPATHSRGPPCGPSRLGRHLDSAKLCHDCIVPPTLFQSLSVAQSHRPRRQAASRLRCASATSHDASRVRARQARKRPPSLLEQAAAKGPGLAAAAARAAPTPLPPPTLCGMRFRAKPSGLQRLNSCLKAQVTVDRWVGSASRVSRSAAFRSAHAPHPGSSCVSRMLALAHRSSRLRV